MPPERVEPSQGGGGGGGTSGATDGTRLKRLLRRKRIPSLSHSRTQLVTDKYYSITNDFLFLFLQGEKEKNLILLSIWIVLIIEDGDRRLAIRKNLFL